MQTTALNSNGKKAPSKKSRTEANDPLQLVAQHPQDTFRILKKSLRDIRKNRFDNPLKLLSGILDSDPENVDALHLLGQINIKSGYLKKAEEHLQQAHRLLPDNIVINKSLGHLYHSLNIYKKAAPHFQKIYEVDQNDLSALVRLAQCFYFLGANDAAMSVTRELINKEDAKPYLTKEKRRTLDNLLCNTIAESRHFYDSSRADVERLFLLDHIDHLKLSPAATLHLKNELSVHDANTTDPDLDGLNKNELLHSLLTKSVVHDADFENWLIQVRRSLLDRFLTKNNLSGCEQLAYSMAVHNFFNEYVYVTTPEELELVEQLCKSLGQHSMHHALLTIALYKPIHQVAEAHDYADSLKNDQSSVAKLIKLTLCDIVEEKKIASEIPALNAIEDKVSRAVQKQYENNPYPRWLKIPHHAEHPYISIIHNVDPYFKPTACLQRRPLNMLVAGCGTGKHPITRAIQVEGAQVLAIDISRSSLSYGKRMANKLNVKNVKFRQSDILNLASLDRKFPVIECVGVLHHMENPERGWEVLRGLLEPGGVMRIGLYSKLARRHIIEIREHIAKNKIEPTGENIKSYRRKLLNNELPLEAGLFTRSSDFNSTSGCRDLLFHVQEHQFTCDRIKNALNNLDLRFLGMDIPRQDSSTQFKAEYPEHSDQYNLDHYDEFERKWPNTFAGMYQFFCTTT